MKCNKCGETREVEFYPSQPTQCKQCYDKKTHEWHNKNRDRARLYNRRYKAKYPDKVKLYREKNKEHTSQYYREWYRKNGRKRAEIPNIPCIQCGNLHQPDSESGLCIMCYKQKRKDLAKVVC